MDTKINSTETGPWRGGGGGGMDTKINSQHRKWTLAKKILLPLLWGLKPGTFHHKSSTLFSSPLVYMMRAPSVMTAVCIVLFQ